MIEMHGRYCTVDIPVLPPAAAAAYAREVCMVNTLPPAAAAAVAAPV